MHDLPPHLGKFLRLHSSPEIMPICFSGTRDRFNCQNFDLSSCATGLGVVLSPNRICKRGSSVQKHQ